MAGCRHRWCPRGIRHGDHGRTRPGLCPRSRSRAHGSWAPRIADERRARRRPRDGRNVRIRRANAPAATGPPEGVGVRTACNARRSSGSARQRWAPLLPSASTARGVVTIDESSAGMLPVCGGGGTEPALALATGPAEETVTRPAMARLVVSRLGWGDSASLVFGERSFLARFTPSGTDRGCRARLARRGHRGMPGRHRIPAWFEKPLSEVGRAGGLFVRAAGLRSLVSSARKPLAVPMGARRVTAEAAVVVEPPAVVFRVISRER